MWSIDSYEDDASVHSDIEAVNERPRQATVSGTNFDSLRGDGSAESFSQPMEQLSLRTPAKPSKLSAVHAPNVEDWCVQQREISMGNGEGSQASSENNALNVSLPSPPLTDQSKHADATMPLDIELDTPPTPDTARLRLSTKRKRIDQGNDQVSAMFDSGSLSSLDDADLHRRHGPIGDQSEVIENDSASGHRTKKGDSRGRAMNNTKGDTPLRQSTRATRNRKSMRVA